MSVLTEVERMLVGARFVNITGLPFSNSFHPKDDGKTIQANPHHYGRWGYNNGICVVVTENGRVWVRYTCKHERFLSKVAPRGRGASVPFSSGETINPMDLLQRITYPLCDFNGMYSPDACPKKATV